MQWAAVIGDVVGSRQVADRNQLQDDLNSALATVGARTGGDLQMTVGDEFQGRYTNLSTGLEASLRLHLATTGIVRLRIGIGWGDLIVEGASDTPFGQDGPAWWRARDAIEQLEGPTLPVRTVVVTESGWDEIVNGYLVLRDSMLEGLDQTDAVIATALLDGETQRAVAGRLDLHESSVSRRVNGHGIAALVATAAPTLPTFGQEP